MVSKHLLHTNPGQLSFSLKQKKFVRSVLRSILPSFFWGSSRLILSLNLPAFKFSVSWSFLNSMIEFFSLIILRFHFYLAIFHNILFCNIHALSLVIPFTILRKHDLYFPPNSGFMILILLVSFSFNSSDCLSPKLMFFGSLSLENIYDLNLKFILLKMICICFCLTVDVDI